jgi:class 3 adenylate cyclase/tetratricopeptide (TPR) repeat protein
MRWGIDMSLPSDQSGAGLSSKSLNAIGEHKIISVLFTDVVNYTSLAEMINLEAVREIINNHFKLLIESVNKYEGTVDQLLGDGMVAFFGAPIAYEDHAQRACHSALAMQDAMQNYAECIRKEYGIDFSIRIGINSGPVLVGPIGNAQHTEYIAVGDTVNLASRMENASRPSGILVTENIYYMARDYFQFEEIGEIGIKGKDKPVMAYRLLRAVKTERRFEAAIARGLTRFVGREQEIDLLRQVFIKTQNGNSQTIGIMGEPGIGKSRLLREFKERIRSEDFTYLEGRCLHYGSSMPYLPLVDIVEAYFDIQEEHSESDSKGKMVKKLTVLDKSLISYLPFLYEMLSFSVEDERYSRMENQYKRNMLFEGLTHILLKEASNRPIVIAIEDLHWIDKASVEFLTKLIAGLSDARILFLLLYRPEYQSNWTNQSNYLEVHLSQLSDSTSSELLLSLLADGEPTSELRETVLAKTGGNPLFVEEFVHSLLENRSIRKEGRYYTLNSLESTIKLPETIQGIIASRIDRLPEGLKNTLQVASVIGRDFSYSVLQDVTQLSDGLKFHLETLQQLEFIFQASDFDEKECFFKHALIQVVAYQSLLQKRRKELHENIAQAIEKLYPQRLEEMAEALAYHYQQSNNLDRAVYYLRKSGQKALVRYAIEESHQYYQQAFESLSNKARKTPEDQSIILDILLEWAEVYYYRGYFRALYDLMSTHQELAEILGDKPRQAMLLGWLGIGLFAASRITESYQVLRHAETLAEESGDPKATAYVCAWLSYTCCFHGLVDEGLACADKAITASRLIEKGDYPYIKALGGKGFILSSAGKNRAALECGRELLEFGEVHGNLRSLALGYYMEAYYYLSSGEIEEALNECRQGLRHKCDPFYSEMLRYMFGLICVIAGRFEDAEESLNQVMLDGRQFGIETFEWMAAALLGMVFISKGQMLKGFRMMTESDNKLLNNGNKFCYIWTQYLLGILYSQLTAPAAPIKISMLAKNSRFILRHVPFATQKAIVHFNNCAAICLDCGFTSISGMVHLELGRLYKNKGQKELAREQLSTAVKLCRESEAAGNLKQAEELLSSMDKRKQG